MARSIKQRIVLQVNIKTVHCIVKPVLSSHSKRTQKIRFQHQLSLKETRSVTMNIFRKKKKFFLNH